VLPVLMSGALGCIRVHSNIEDIRGWWYYNIEIFDNNEFYCQTINNESGTKAPWSSHCRNEKYQYTWTTTGATGQYGTITKSDLATGTKGALGPCLTYRMFSN
jgi:hypothetical protein